MLNINNEWRNVIIDIEIERILINVYYIVHTHVSWVSLNEEMFV